MTTIPITCIKENCNRKVSRKGKTCSYHTTIDNRIAKQKAKQEKKKAEREKEFENNRVNTSSYKITRNLQRSENEFKPYEKEKQTEHTSAKDLVTLADTLFSEYIKLRDTNFQGFASCWTCGKFLERKQMQCGHFEKRGKSIIRWDQRNAGIQCSKCNCEKDGEYNKMKKEIDKYFGYGTADEITCMANNPTFDGYDANDVRYIIESYREKIKQLNKERKYRH